MLTINFGAEEDSPSRPRSAASMDSSQSLPPPLPGSLPPPAQGNRLRSQSPGGDSYYLPSADEVSELEEGPRSRTRRAGSVPPKVRLHPHQSDPMTDSAYSEPGSLPTLGMGLPPRKKSAGKRVSASLDSIPDDSGFQDVDSKILKEKIGYLEDQVKAKETELKAIKDDLKAKENKAIQDLQKKVN